MRGPFRCLLRALCRYVLEEKAKTKGTLSRPTMLVRPNAVTRLNAASLGHNLYDLRTEVLLQHHA